MLNFGDSFGSQNSSDTQYVGYAGEAGNIVMIIISILGIIINSIFSFDYLKNIISIKNRNNDGISAVEKILCMIAMVETFISVFWLINNLKSKSLNGESDNCEVIAYFEIILNIFDWLILSTSLYQIKIILLNPQKILESGRRVFKYIIACLIISLVGLVFSYYAEIGGLSPMLTCFIRLENLVDVKRTVLFFIFFTIPLFCFAFGGYQVYLIIKSPQYKNDINNRRFFMEYSYFVITYIISSILLILTYVIYYIIHNVDETIKKNAFYKFFIALVTFLTCATPLIVGIIRYYRTGLFKRIVKCCKRKRNFSMQENGEELINIKDENNDDFRMFNYEKKMIENLIVKYFTAVSFALGKSKYDDEEGEKKEEDDLKDEPRNYRINRDEILKDLDLSLNDDIKVLTETNIDIEVTEYNVSIFKKLRRLENLDEDKIIEMIQPKNGTNDLIQQKNETMYINSPNKLLMLKKIKREKMLNFQRNILPHLYDYFSNNKNSLICRVFGLYRIKIEQQDEIYMALTYNIHESLGNNANNTIVKQMKLTEMELRQRLKSVTKTAIFTAGENLMESIDNRNDLTTDVNAINTKASFKVLLTETENDELENIMDKEKEFLKKIGINRYNYIIFERKINNNVDLINFSDSSIKTGKSNESSNLLFNNIKKYEFKSSNATTIYCICINGI